MCGVSSVIREVLIEVTAGHHHRLGGLHEPIWSNMLRFNHGMEHLNFDIVQCSVKSTVV